MKIPKFFKRKRNIVILAIVIVLLLIGYFVLGGKNKNGLIQTAIANRQDLKETVLATGQVVSNTSLELGFQASGIVRRVLVKEGDKVRQGQLLASLDTASAYAALTSANGALAQARANYDKLMAGATQQSVKVSQDTVNAARQDLANTYNGAINTLNTGYTALYNAYSEADSVHRTYFSAADQQGIKVQLAKSNLNQRIGDVKKNLDLAQSTMAESDIDGAILGQIVALSGAYNDVNIIRLQCEEGIYYTTVSSTDKSALDTEKAALTTALASINTLKSNIASYKLALQKAESQLAVTTAPPTQAEIDLQRAQIQSAEGQVASAQATVNNLLIYAPASGTITKVDIKIGEQATALKEAIVLQDVENLYAEANVSEANVASLKVGQPIDFTFDALGPNQHFTGKVLTINPASNVVSGAVYYLVKGSFDNIPEVKPGMTANMTILVSEKSGVLAVPSTAVINKNNKRYVRIMNDLKKRTYQEAEVQTGMQADGGLVEILSGVTDGQTIITYIKP